MALDTVFVISSQNYQIARKIRSGTASNAFSEGGIHCINSGSNDITIIVTHYYPWLWHWYNVSVGRYPVAAVDGSHSKFYVANFWSDSVSSIYFPPGIEEYSSLSTSLHMFEIYPNPARNYFTIRLPQSTDRSQIKIFDVTGKVVKEILPLHCVQGQNDNTVRVSLDGVKNGVYFVKVGTINKKIIVTK
jgi:hypothetical protein